MDPRVLAKYCETLHYDLQYYNIRKKCESLQKTSQDGTWSADHEAEFNSIDTLITKAMLHAEKTAGKAPSCRYQWSPTLKEAVQA
jgi:hypothetical protein